jgi:hypothetical protein
VAAGPREGARPDGKKVMAAATTRPCEHCGAEVPRLSLTPSLFGAVVRALQNGSKTLAAAEVKHSAGCEDSEARSWLDHLLSCVHAWPFAQEDQPVLDRIDRAFGGIYKPEHFTNHAHCDECAEHDNTLRSRTRETLRREDLGNPAWDPLTFSSEEGIAYVFPAIARYAVLPDAWPRHEWYGCQLLSHLSHDGDANRFLRWCSDRQREAVHALLEHLEATRMPDFDNAGCRDALMVALALWQPAR